MIRNFFVTAVSAMYMLGHLCRQRLWWSNVSRSLTTFCKIKNIFTFVNIFSDSSARNELQESSRTAMMPRGRWKMYKEDTWRAKQDNKQVMDYLMSSNIQQKRM